MRFKVWKRFVGRFIQERLANAGVVSVNARKFGTGQWSFIGHSFEKKWYSISEDSPQGIWAKIAERMLLEFAESGCPIFRVATPLSRGQLKSKGHGKLSPTRKRLRLFFALLFLQTSSVFTEQSQRYVKSTSPFTKKTLRPVVMGQTIVLSAIKTEILLDSDDPTHQNFLLQQYEERIEKLSQQDKLSKFCMDARFLSVVENGQYFMT